MERGLLTCERVDWRTPRDFFAELDREFGFTLDPCATVASAVCARFFTEADNGLERSWAGERVFMNPPYGREIGLWMRKADTEAQGGALVVCLVPARTDTGWWWESVMPYYPAGVRFVRGRLRFDEAGPAPFPSAVVVMRRELRVS